MDSTYIPYSSGLYFNFNPKPQRKQDVVMVGSTTSLPWLEMYATDEAAKELSEFGPVRKSPDTGRWTWWLDPRYDRAEVLAWVAKRWTRV